MGQTGSPTFLEWTLSHRWIRDKEAGEVLPFSLKRYPWLRYIYKAIGDLLPNGRAVIKKAAQIGATELAINFSFFHLDGLGSVFYALPPGPVQNDFAHARIDPAVGASPHILGMVEDIDNVGLKVFQDGFNLYIRGTNVTKGDPRRAAQLSEAPADIAIMDEFDRIPPAAVPLVRARLEDSVVRKEICLSTPTYPDVGIDTEYQTTKCYEPQIKCTKCGQWYWLDWTLIRGPVADDPHARVMCPVCRVPIDRTNMWDEDQPGGARARWEPQNPEATDVGFWIPRLVSERADLDEMWARSKAIKDLDIDPDKPFPVSQ